MTPDELCEKNIKLAYSVANFYAMRLPHPRDAHGLRSECLEAMLRAARAYDPARGTRFSTLAVQCMKRASEHFIAKEWRRGLAGHMPEVRPSVCCDADSGEDSAGPIELAEARGSSPHVAWDEVKWDRVLSSLDKRSRAVVRARFIEGLTLARIAARHQMTKERVRQILVTALARIKRCQPDLAEEIQE